MKHYVILVLLLLFNQNIFAQTEIYPTTHRPYSLDWHILKTEHFRVIFPKGEENSAYKTANILENYYPKASKIIGGKLNNFPVVLTNYNDNSNGFVTSNNFRSEFDLAPMKGKSLNPKSGNWLETVLPHELLHAVHINVNSKYSIGNLIRLLSPDASRSLNFTPPVGLHEGLAVWFESTYTKPNAGRLNSTHFNNQFNANLNSDKTWSLSQLFQPSDNTRPYNRNYIGGANFMQWLGNKYGEDIFRKSILFNYKYFFLGYGFALKREASKWPNQLYKEYQLDILKNEQHRLNLITDNTDTLHKPIKTPYKGAWLHKPIWINENEIIYFGQYYNSKQGFYKFNKTTNTVQLLKETNVSNNYGISYDKTNNTLYFSGYSAHLLYNDVYTLDAKELDIKSNKINYLTSKKRIYSPAKINNGFIALQTNKNSANIVKFSSNKTIERIKAFQDDIPISLVSNPNNRNQIAVIINKDGHQALWLTNVDGIKSDLEKHPTVYLENGAIYDVDWHPKENKLLFTADIYPSMNIYEYDINKNIVTQLTSSTYNAMEASYAPDGNAIVYSYQQNNEQKLAILERNYFVNKVIDNNNISDKLVSSISKNDSTNYNPEWIIKEYKTDLTWLKPRSIMPTLKENYGLNQFGVAALSTDVLGSHSYIAEISRLQNKFWYNIQYSNKAFFPGFTVSAFSDPSFSYFDTDRNNDGKNDITGTNKFEKITLLNSEKGFRFSVPLKFNAKQTNRTTSLYVTPNFWIDKTQYLDLSLNSISENTATQYKLGYSAQINWRVLKLPRDIQPRAGLILFSSLKKSLNTEELDLYFPQTGNKYRLLLNEKWGHHYGLFGYVAPLAKYNQSLRLDLQFLQQSQNLLYSTGSIRPMGFKGHVFPNSPYLARLSAKYTIPLFYPDNGSLLVPLHFKTLYLSMFSHTITNLETNNYIANSRTIIGGGLHFRYNFGNIALDFGVGLGFEPSKNNLQFIYGDF